MSRWVKLIATGESVNDSSLATSENQVVQLFEEEVRRATADLKQQRQMLQSAIQQQSQCEQWSTELAQQIEQFESYALKALDQRNETLARDIAAKICDLEDEKKEVKQKLMVFQLETGKLRAEVRQMERDLKRNKQQLDTAQAAENVQKAQLVLVSKGDRSAFGPYSAIDAVKNMKKKSEASRIHTVDSVEREEDGDGELMRKLEEAGIIQNSKQDSGIEFILNRLKKQRT